MWRSAGLALALILAATGPALAEAPLQTPRPLARPGLVLAEPAVPVDATAPIDRKRPQARPGAPSAPPETASPVMTVEAVADAGLASSQRPHPRPNGVSRSATSQPAGLPKPGTRGVLCGDSALKGVVLAPIVSRVKGCGQEAPVAVEQVLGVRLNPPATLDCTTAEALKTWVKKGLQPAFAPAKVIELRIFGSYVCRGRNNQRGARISEHGRAKAVDIGGFVLDSGRLLTVLEDYSRPIRKAQSAACGIFGTTLGPGSDGYHENHLHFDTAAYRNGPYCH